MEGVVFTAWAVQTSKKWSDLAGTVKRIGIDFIDYDHKTLVEFALKLNKVIDETENGYTLAIINETKLLLNDIYKYTDEHFTREEQFMKDYQLPEIEKHITEHQRILKMIRTTIADYNNGNINITKYLKANILDWIINHVNISDVAYFDIENWSANILRAKNWDDISAIIRLIGIEEIDEQHRKMTNIALESIDALNNNSTPQAVDNMANALNEYARYHFSYEENFMRQQKIGKIEAHINEHQSFINKINEYAEKIKNDISEVQELKSWLIKWWINHINKTDSYYFSFANWGLQKMENAKKAEDITILLRKTGIKEIDDEHLELMVKTFELYDLYRQQNENPSDNKIRDKAIVLFAEIYKAAADHFRAEEQRMIDNKMEDYKFHLAEHREILKKISDIKDNYEKGRLDLSENIKTMLLDWWISHTNTTDYRTFVHNVQQNKNKPKIISR